MRRPLPRLPLLLLPPCLVLALWLGGCADSGRQSYATEADEPYYRQADQLKRGNRYQEALSAYLKVIEKRGDDAPESHLETGLIYLHHIRDPIAAIYHFRKYLALRPNTPQAPLVRQRIDAAIREFARTLPAQPLENQLQRVDLIAAMDKLKLENDLLKQQLADLQAGRAVPEEPAAASGPDFSISLEAMPSVRTRSPRTEPPAVRAPVSAPAVRTPAAAPKQPAAAPAPRRHVVRAGDTLSKLALQYYGDRAKWRDLYAANRGVMRNEGDLKIGMELVIP